MTKAESAALLAIEAAIRQLEAVKLALVAEVSIHQPIQEPVVQPVDESACRQHEVKLLETMGSETRMCLSCGGTQ